MKLRVALVNLLRKYGDIFEYLDTILGFSSDILLKRNWVDTSGEGSDM